MVEAKEKEKRLFRATVVLCVRNGKVLLARKTRRIGAGKWNGYGGGIEEGETPRECAVRETFEETSEEGKSNGIRILPEDLEYVGYALFHNHPADGDPFDCVVYAYIAKKFEGEPYESEQMATPTWFPDDKLPFDEMMAGDREWFPPMLLGVRVRLEAWYGPRQESFLKPSVLVVVDELPE